ncbi:hypothetical protein BU17DRAFT_82396 [Hysterangium stoloniferum]|nr:hypothetical protein BU17DRAFT_82396 [Hysterangium stoloniferum]
MVSYTDFVSAITSVVALLWGGRDAPPTNLGFKVLVEGDSPVVDIVAIHGLDGDRERSWTAENDTLWLRDFLPDDVPNARILTYGYDSATRGRMQLSDRTIHDHAEDLINKLVMHRRGIDTQNRPIIFVAHSLGGIVLKFALIVANGAHDQHRVEHKSIATSTTGLVFLGTPHQGTDSTDLILLLLKIQSLLRPTNKKVAQHLTANSEVLQDQLDQYNSISRLYNTVFFYETYSTPIPGGLSQVLVQKHTAVVPGAVDAEAIGLNKSHTGMSKFDSRDDDYLTVSFHIKTLVKKALESRE